jgi:hypothetical protein
MRNSKFDFRSLKALVSIGQVLSAYVTGNSNGKIINSQAPVPSTGVITLLPSVFI